MNITKQQVLENIEIVKKYISESEQEKKEEKIIGIAIKNRFTGSIIFQSTKTTYKEAVKEAVDSANKNNTYANLTDADLTYADLTRANLTRADLTRADLTYANLTDADLTRANLTDADLTYANLTACKFYMGSLNKNFEALCKAIKTIKWNSNTGADFIK